MSAKQAKTVIVVVGRMREHPLYKKVIRLRKRFAAHDEAGDVREGDLVRIQESRPFSATKRWRVVEVLSRAGEAAAAAPRAADIERMLEQAEGVQELLVIQFVEGSVNFPLLPRVRRCITALNRPSRRTHSNCERSCRALE